ncbi:acVLRF1 family peptidyl-tRNA hydrolase [Saccharothrix lopnurensis]|uniref:AcVLRF1 family peptidyl-tRNA hydrolase n=1 Tax=Saccharothrix lopnurensis TaxID=1670621 RepID=A0ABW1P140_9PSEU
MSRVRPVSGGGRAVEVEPERLTRWFERFAGLHGGVATTAVTEHEFLVTAVDGTTASVSAAFGRLTPEGEPDRRSPGGSPPSAASSPASSPAGLPPAGRSSSPSSSGPPSTHRSSASSSGRVFEGLVLDPLLANALTPRRLGLLLVRLGGHSIGVALDGRVLVSTTDSHQVHGRNKAGGWSQQRFARRREGQARVALHAAADDAARVLAPRVAQLDAVVLGGDRQALDALRADRRLAEVFALASPRVLDVPEPRRAVLDEAAVRARAVEVVVREPPETRDNPQPAPPHS